MTGPHTTAVPGLFRAGRAGLAEELGWSQEAFDKAFAEVFEQGMAKADWRHRVVWIPNAIKHNEPASPNVVKSWATELDLIPECELKAEAVNGITVALSVMNPAYSEAFASFGQVSKVSRKASGKASAKPLPKTMANQEQEQEQEEAKTLALTAPANLPPDKTKRSRSKAKPSDPRHAICKGICAEYAKHKGVEFVWDASEAKALALLLEAAPEMTVETFTQCVRNRVRSDVAHGERPRLWLGTLSRYQVGPLDRFGKPIGDEDGTSGKGVTGAGGANRNGAAKRTEGNIDAAVRVYAKLAGGAAGAC